MYTDMDIADKSAYFIINEDSNDEFFSLSFNGTLISKLLQIPKFLNNKFSPYNFNKD